MKDATKAAREEASKAWDTAYKAKKAAAAWEAAVKSVMAAWEEAKAAAKAAWEEVKGKEEELSREEG